VKSFWSLMGRRRESGCVLKLGRVRTNLLLWQPLTVLAQPVPLRRLCQICASQVDPLVRTVRVVARDHITVRDILAVTIFRIIDSFLCFFLFLFLRRFFFVLAAFFLQATASLVPHQPSKRQDYGACNPECTVFSPTTYGPQCPTNPNYPGCNGCTSDFINGVASCYDCLLSANIGSVTTYQDTIDTITELCAGAQITIPDPKVSATGPPPSGPASGTTAPSSSAHAASSPSQSSTVVTTPSKSSAKGTHARYWMTAFTFGAVWCVVSI